MKTWLNFSWILRGIPFVPSRTNALKDALTWYESTKGWKGWRQKHVDQCNFRHEKCTKYGRRNAYQKERKPACFFWLSNVVLASQCMIEFLEIEKQCSWSSWQTFVDGINSDFGDWCDMNMHDDENINRGHNNPLIPHLRTIYNIIKWMNKSRRLW